MCDPIDCGRFQFPGWGKQRITAARAAVKLRILANRILVLVS